MKLAILGNDSDSWHLHDLKRAARKDVIGSSDHWVAESQISIQTVSFSELAAIVGQIQQHPLEAFDCVFNRAMPAGSLQQVVFRMDVLLELERRGLPIVNSPRAIETSVDKYLALTKMAAVGVPVPITMVAQTVEVAIQQFHTIIQDVGQSVIVKPLFGSMGVGLQRINDAQSAKKTFGELVEQGQVIYQQVFIDHGGEDLRLLVIGDQVIAMKRVNENGWVTNIGSGGVGQPHEPTKIETELAITAAQAVGAKIAGVDLLYDCNTNQPYVIEVNSAPAWKALSQCTDIDVAAEILEYCKSVAL